MSQTYACHNCGKNTKYKHHYSDGEDLAVCEHCSAEHVLMRLDTPNGHPAEYAVLRLKEQ